jgi:hypothetical protein
MPKKSNTVGVEETLYAPVAYNIDCAVSLRTLAKKKPHILLIENLPILQEYLGKSIFPQLGYHVTIINQGLEALTLTSQSIDILFLNVDLPDTNCPSLIFKWRIIQKALGI